MEAAAETSTVVAQRKPVAPEPGNAKTAISETKTAPNANGVGMQQGGSRNQQNSLGLVPQVQSKVARILHVPPVPPRARS